MSSTEPAAWRDHYTALCREGEAAGLTFNALGAYISQRMTDQELRAMLDEWSFVIQAARVKLSTTIPREAAP